MGMEKRCDQEAERGLVARRRKLGGSMSHPQAAKVPNWRRNTIERKLGGEQSLKLLINN